MSSASMSDIPSKDERFEFTTFFEGHTTAWGVFEDRFGHLRRRFQVEMVGAWRDQTFYLDEDFVYDTGETEHRTWRVKAGQDGAFSATCADCVGEARGLCASDSIRMAYRFRLKLNTRTLLVDFDDRVYPMGGGHAVNRAIMRKWGVKLGELSLFFQRHDGQSAAAAE